jgi:signal-transduction protein with cAMP-binding, CBS, and nucleotidyltransferase domain
MTGFLDFAEPPFSSLDAAERQRVRDAVSVASFKAGETLRDSDTGWRPVPKVRTVVPGSTGRRSLLAPGTS